MIVVGLVFTFMLFVPTVAVVPAPLDASQCLDKPNRPIIYRPTPPIVTDPAPPVACKTNMTNCTVTANCCAGLVCRNSTVSTLTCQRPCNKTRGVTCTMSDVCCSGDVCRADYNANNALKCLPPCVNAFNMCIPGSSLCCDKNFACLVNETVGSNPNVGTCLNNFCRCADKSESIEGQGKVTGGGWIYLTNKTFLNPAHVCGTGACDANALKNIFAESIMENKKSNYGFNAMWRKGQPMGSTNFVLDGGVFHFHSDTQNKPYKGLEVVDEVHARWWGTGKVAVKADPRKNDWLGDMAFMVAVQDHGEPGADDTWRIRIWKTSVCGFTGDPLTEWTTATWNSCSDNQAALVFDTNYVPFYSSGTIHSGVTSNPNLKGNVIITSDKWTHTNYTNVFPLPSSSAATDTGKWRFNGTQVGSLVQNGGGNIQIHIPHRKNKFVDYLSSTNGACPCVETKNVTEVYDKGFVTGGGYIFLDTGAYLRADCNCPSGSMTTTRYDGDLSTCAVVNMTGVRANYGFNAKTINGLGQGHTNFVMLGKGFHFQSEKMGSQNQDYDNLEVVCDNKYGPGGKGVYARWSGIGRVARTIADAATPSTNSPLWESGYRYYLAVQDLGEPGKYDTFRLRIEDTPNCAGAVLFDTDVYTGPIWSQDTVCGLNLVPEGCNEDTNSGYPTFEGTQVGVADNSTGGGGNIQLHCKGGPS